MAGDGVCLREIPVLVHGTEHCSRKRRTKTKGGMQVFQNAESCRKLGSYSDVAMETGQTRYLCRLPNDGYWYTARPEQLVVFLLSPNVSVHAKLDVYICPDTRSVLLHSFVTLTVISVRGSGQMRSVMIQCLGALVALSMEGAPRYEEHM